MIFRKKYSVHVEDVVTGADYCTGHAWTRKGMLRKVRKGNGRVSGVPIRFFGKIER